MADAPLHAAVAMPMEAPVRRVPSAIVDAEQLSQYFVTASSASLVAGQEVRWEFGDTCAAIGVQVQSVTPNRVVFHWGASGQTTEVSVQLEAQTDQTTKVSIREGPWEFKRDSIPRLLEQTQGWTHFLCCLKAWIEHGLNLRAGSYAQSAD